MVTIISAFLGLVLGVQPVELSVTGDVDSVELRLDQRTVAVLRGEPWVAAVDFGPDLAPHELLAIARDGDGGEIWRAERRINMPQARSQVEIFLKDGATDRRGSLVWRSADGDRPDEWIVSFDDRVLEVDDPAEFALPAHDPEEVHVIRAALRFGRSVARGELVFGGAARDEMNLELTALVFDLVGGGEPTAEEMEGWFSIDGKPLEVVAVEKGGADIIAVHEATPRAWGALLKLRRQILESGDRNPLKKRLASGLNHEDVLKVMLPVGVGEPGKVTKFHISKDFSQIEYGATSSGVGVQTIAGSRAYGLLASFPYPLEGPLAEEAPRQTADAVAIAAQVASAANRARAVVLVHEPGSEDISQHEPDAVRRYLESLQVPLFVWSVGRAKTDDVWGESATFASQEKFMRVSLALRDALDRQRVVWVRGRHLVREIEMSDAASRRLARVAAPVELDTDQESEFLPWIAEAEDTAPEPVAAVAPAEEPEEIASETFTESVEVRLVEIDAVVSGADGVPLRSLTAEDFELVVDGKPVEIQSFEAPAAVGAGAAQAAEGGAAAPVEPRNLVVFLDMSDLNPRKRKGLAGALRETLAAQAAEPGTRTMLVTYDKDMRIRTPLTDDPALLGEVLAQVESGEIGTARVHEDRSDVFREIARVRAALNAGRPGEAGLRAAQRDRDLLVSRISAVSQELANSVRQRVRALRALSSSLGGVDGRKTVIYIGEGLEYSPGRELFEEAERTLGLVGGDLARLRVEAQGGNARGDFDKLLEEATTSGVTLFTLVPEADRVGDDVEGTSAASAGFAARGSGTLQESEKEAACQLSGGTGGLCQVGGSEPSDFLERARRDLSAAYTLAFAPEGPADGEFHEVEVRLRPGAVDAATEAAIRHAPGYTDALPGSRAQAQLAAALLFGRASNSLGVELAIGDSPGEASGDLRIVALELRVPVSRLGVTPIDGGDRFGVDAELLVATRDADGRTTAVQEYPVTFQFDRQRLESNQALVYAHKIHLTLPAGEHEVAVGFWDTVSKAGSFVTDRVAAN